VLWGVFAFVVVAMLVLDLGVLHRRPHDVGVREALLWSAVWIGLALGFFGLVIGFRGTRVGLEFLACYLIEESLSVDNLFVFLLLFTYFKVPSNLQHKALFWGVAGAVITRGAFIAGGVAVIQRFHWLVYVLGALLVVMGIRMSIAREQQVHPERNPVLRLVRWFLPVTPGYVGSRFFTREAGRRLATPLLVVLVVIETTDVVFAIDSVPAALAISLNPMVVFTANIFAVLGLRSMYFALAGLMPMFVYLHYGLACILVLTGAKMIASLWFDIPIGVVLGVVGGILLISVFASMAKARGERKA
jgi:tellurite resistance protein TerC